MFKQIGQVSRELSAGSREEMPSPASLPVSAADNPPTRVDRNCDIDIPNKVWSPIHVEGQRREIVRALTTTERGALARRQGELASAVVGFSRAQTDRVALAISDMFGGFRSVTRGYDEETAIAMTDGIRRMLAPLPAWAIEQGCRAIQRGDAGLDHKFLPNDNEIYDVIDRLVKPYRAKLLECEALLNAPVEAPIKHFAQAG